jgi:hypothetical protein
VLREVDLDMAELYGGVTIRSCCCSSCAHERKHERETVCLATFDLLSFYVAFNLFFVLIML